MNTEEIIHLIENLGGKYDPGSPLSAYDQYLACESINGSTQIIQNGQYKKETEENDSVNGNVIDSYKRNVNFELTQYKRNVITILESCSYRTPPKALAELLDRLFDDRSTKKGHWLYIAQHWNPRAILRVINKLVKVEISGKISIQNPAAYFTHLIKYRKKRRNI